MADDRINNLSSLFRNSRTRLIIVATAVMLAVMVVVGLAKMRQKLTTQSAQEETAAATVSEVPTNIKSVPGAFNPTAEYANLQEKQNHQNVEQAMKNGGSAIPTLIRSQRIVQHGDEDLSACERMLKEAGLLPDNWREGCAMGANGQLTLSGAGAENARASLRSRCEALAGDKAKKMTDAQCLNLVLSKSALHAKASLREQCRRIAGSKADKMTKAQCEALIATHSRASQHAKLREQCQKLAGPEAEHLSDAQCSALVASAASSAKHMALRAQCQKLAGEKAKTMSDAQCVMLVSASRSASQRAALRAQCQKLAGPKAKTMSDAQCVALVASQDSAAMARRKAANAAALAKLKKSGLTAAQIAELEAQGLTPEQIAALRAAGLSAEEIEAMAKKGLSPEQMLAMANANGDAAGSADLEKLLQAQNAQMAADARMQRQQMLRKQQVMRAQASQLFASWQPNVQSFVNGTSDGSASADVSVAGGPTHVLARAGSIVYAVLETSVNTDEPGPVLATIVGEGPFKGAKLMGKLRVNPRGEKVLLTFNLVSLPGHPTSTPINAVAVDPETSRTAFASHIDRHILQRYGLLFASEFMSGFGQAVSESGATITKDTDSTFISNPGLTGGDKSLVAMGKVGSALSTRLAPLFDRPATIKVYSGTSMGILFLTDLKA